jgi:hypothetical protein
MNRSLRIADHAQACAVLNALREHRDTFPYYQVPLDTPDKREAYASMTALVRQAEQIYDAFVRQAWRDGAP